MYSPFKLCGFEKNYHEISSNLMLAEEIKLFFADPANNYLWKLHQHRQQVTHALRNTEMVSLRHLIIQDRSQMKNTNDYNQQMTVADTAVLKQVPMFQTLVKWLEDSFKNAGASNVSWGRIFFSKHAANSDIGEHVDEGKYFDYYDRFHFVIRSEGTNIFHIRDEDIELQTGHLYWVNNHVPHWLVNHSDSPRINLIVDARLI
jgi:mannose-6-phosphate isomerase-like protein (cupin superfamily)